MGLPTTLQADRSLYFAPAAADAQLVCTAHSPARAYLLWPAMQATPDWMHAGWTPVSGSEVKVSCSVVCDTQSHPVAHIGVCPAQRLMCRSARSYQLVQHNQHLEDVAAGQCQHMCSSVAVLALMKCQVCSCPASPSHTSACNILPDFAPSGPLGRLLPQAARLAQHNQPAARLRGAAAAIIHPHQQQRRAACWQAAAAARVCPVCGKQQRAERTMRAGLPTSVSPVPRQEQHQQAQISCGSFCFDGCRRLL